MPSAFISIGIVSRSSVSISTLPLYCGSKRSLTERMSGACFLVDDQARHPALPRDRELPVRVRARRLDLRAQVRERRRQRLLVDPLDVAQVVHPLRQPVAGDHQRAAAGVALLEQRAHLPEELVVAVDVLDVLDGDARLVLELGDRLVVDVERPVGDRQVAAGLALGLGRRDLGRLVVALDARRRRRRRRRAARRRREASAGRHRVGRRVVAVTRSPSICVVGTRENQASRAGRITACSTSSLGVASSSTAGRRASPGTSAPRARASGRRARRRPPSAPPPRPRSTPGTRARARGRGRPRRAARTAPPIRQRASPSWATRWAVNWSTSRARARAGCRARRTRRSRSDSISTSAKCSSASRIISWREANQ